MAAPAKRWVVRIYWESTQTLDATAISLVLCRLEGNSTVTSQRQVDDRWEATVTVEAPTIQTAGSTAWNLVAGAGERPHGLEVLRQDRGR